MNFNSKKTSLIILGLTSIVGSKTFFALLDDPEGPNLLIVFVLTVVIYFLSTWAVRLLSPSTTGPRRILLAICFQIIIVAGLYFFLG